MSRSFQAPRSKEAPMDYEWTNRADTRPVWSGQREDPSTPRKRSFAELNPASPTLGNPMTPTFGRNQNVPFLFNGTPLPQTPHGHPWVPPPQLSPSKPFVAQPEINDVDMTEVTPSKPEEKDKESEPRPVATGGLRRVYNQRNRSRNRARTRRSSEDHEDSGLGSASEEEEDRIALRPQKTSNHYTLNLPAHPSPPSDTPYVLLGYLQFFFNLSLILLFLYLVIQFILTVQRDVEKRISEYSQEIVQEIAMCAAQYKNNYCGTRNVAPAMIQQCANWETCTNRDPTTVGRARISAELIAEVINGFVEPISWKTLIFTLTSLAFLTVFINALLSLYRARYQPITAPAHQPPSFPNMPATPYPSHPFGAYLTPAPAPNWGRHKGEEEEMESPTRRRRLEGGNSVKIK